MPHPPAGGGGMGGARKDGIYLQLQCKFMLALFAGFHGVENWVPWCGKTAKPGSMAWKEG